MPKRDAAWRIREFAPNRARPAGRDRQADMCGSKRRAIERATLAKVKLSRLPGMQRDCSRRAVIEDRLRHDAHGYGSGGRESCRARQPILRRLWIRRQQQRRQKHEHPAMAQQAVHSATRRRRFAFNRLYRLTQAHGHSSRHPFAPNYRMTGYEDSRRRADGYEAMSWRRSGVRGGETETIRRSDDSRQTVQSSHIRKSHKIDYGTER